MRAEWPGILAWMIVGCRKWQSTGLRPPATIIAATKLYLDTEDAVGSWVDECCDRDPLARETRAALWRSWSAWAIKEGEAAGSQKSFYQKLNAHGFHPARTNNARFFVGLKIR